ncbi:bifunctional 2-keto-4-hydroxyglutarate aldolase/2-keto-3-deoxy-6-phosphogluconate aldolase [Furfurilactobacillus milii]|uniref:Bifunctional 4-hydroxy-2-oxoglutarate aldolase/2-dehydro-3-deoxy-phosphogluconate aldolase n=1 Tax=Furfurilactobacillus milii TaxID=2888272 RepID=A0A6N9I324_9LACO|nr:bifunctional 2-keto-4-hydroxyglutarate aldolase/2-keto-3-deoxy-6-phosphogluconate aldolase [Furfurilactobacillus milii]MYV17542.1 bifunctional 4-hydroxy-2-oxoglutarate aldolase/2-dehydro-3-deoxy-phosphogluconate aldolase [Furfurilactobacillus milii]
MKREKLLKKLTEVGVVSVVRAETAEKAVKIADAVIAGGVRGIELTYTVPHADTVIGKLVEKHGVDALIGAGTVLDAASARLAIIAGAQFIVSPTFDTDVAKMCNLYQIPYVPGIFTPTEAQTALQYGSEVVKLFPGALATPMAISEFKGPFPYLNVMPSGGVNTDNLKDWIKAGAVVVGAGGGLVGPAKNDDYDAVTANAEAYMHAYTEATNNDKNAITV